MKGLITMAIAKLNLNRVDEMLNAPTGTTHRIGHNTTATNSTGLEVVIKYHGNPIAHITRDEILLTASGWPTISTTGRLNQVLNHYGLCEHSYNIRNGRLHLDGTPIHSMAARAFSRIDSYPEN